MVDNQNTGLPQFDSEYKVGQLITSRFSESYLAEANGGVFEKNHSYTIFSRFFADTFEAANTLYVIIGSDSGLLPFYLAQKFAGDARQGRKFIVIDYLSLFDQLNVEDLPKWVECYPANFPMAALGQLEIEYVAASKIRLVSSLSVIDAKQQSAYYWLGKHYEAEYQRFSFAEGVATATRSFVDAQLMNLHRNKFPVKDFRNKLKGFDVVIIGGGPSFDDEVEWLKQQQDRFIVVAAARMSKRLQAENIIPDFVVSVDPHDLSFDNSKEMFNFDDRTVLLNCNHINPKLLNQWPHHAIYFANALPWKADENSASPGPTVIHSALHQLVFMGVDNVYLVGVDLCFKGGQTHAKGTAESEIGKLGVKHAIKQVMTYSGELAETDEPFEVGVDNLAWLIKGYAEKAPDVRIYNTNLYAAKVEGIKHISSDSILLPSPQDKTVVIESIQSQLQCSQAEWLEHQQLMLDEVNQIIERLEKLQAISQQALEKIDNTDEEFSDKDDILTVKNELDEVLGDLGELLFHYGVENFNAAFQPVEDESAMKHDEITHTLHAYFEGMSKTSQSFLKLLYKAQEILQFRRQEWADELNFLELAEQWKKRFEVGRYRIWQAYHPDYQFNEQEQAEIETLHALLIKNIENVDTEQASLFRNRSLSPVELHKKAEAAFAKQDIVLVEQLQQQVAKLSGIDAVQLQILLEAMLHDLQGEDLLACEAYRKINFVYFKQFAFKRLLHFSLATKQHDQVLFYLEKLCEFSLDYLIPYSDYLAILGYVKEASSVLEMFLKHHPSHQAAWLKLVELKLSAGQQAEAIGALEQAQQLDPDNPQIKAMLAHLKPETEG